MYRRTIQIRPEIPSWADAVLVALVSAIGTCTLAAQPPAPPACDSTVMIMVMDGHAQRLTRTHCSIRTVIDTASLGGESARTLSAALAGRIASLGVLQSSGVLGAGSRVRFRGGYGLIVPREPLLIIDGVRADGGQSSLGIDIGGQSSSGLDDMPLDDIARIEVLPATSCSPSELAAIAPSSATAIRFTSWRRSESGRDGCSVRRSSARASPRRSPCQSRHCVTTLTCSYCAERVRELRESGASANGWSVSTAARAAAVSPPA
jgi:hypothetical protein